MPSYTWILLPLWLPDSSFNNGVNSFSEVIDGAAVRQLSCIQKQLKAAFEFGRLDQPQS